MYFRNVALDDYRSYRSLVVELEPGVCVLVGRNGQGKTNFIEALTYLSTLHSHRVSADTALVRYPLAGEDPPAAGVIRVKVIEEERARLVDLEIVAGKANRARLGRSQVAPRDILGEVLTVLFAPEDLDIVRGGPDGRRRFLDDLIATRVPVMAGIFAEHARILRQRAALLKRASAQVKRGVPADLSTLDVWDAQLAGVAARIIVERHRLVSSLAPHIARMYEVVSEGSSVLSAHYAAQLTRHVSDVDLGDETAVRASLLEAYAGARDDEARRGANLVGPHLDDLALTLGGMPVRGFASHGETWSTALALRLAHFELTRSEGRIPVLVLDDVFAELDASRRRALLDVMAEAEQVLITAAVEDDIPTSLRATLYRVERDSDGVTTMMRLQGAADE